MTKTLAMFDDVNVSLLPPGYDAYASYADGRYENFEAVKARFPKAHIVKIDVRGAYHNGDVLDVEKGDATNADAPGWFKSRKGRTETTTKPVLYTSASNITALVGTMSKAGINRSEYLIWSAHYTQSAHICGEGCNYPKADATQWTSKALGRSLDESLVNSYFFKGTKVPTPNITAALRAAEALDTALSKVKNTTAVNNRVSRMRKTLASQIKYLQSKEVK